MFGIKSFIFTLFLICFSSLVNANNNNDQQIIIQFMKENKIPGVAVQLYSNGKSQSYYFGYANRDKKTPVTKKTIFEIGSISKIITALLLAQQVDSAKIQLDESVKQIFPELSEQFTDISLLNLATHTSALPFETKPTLHSKTQLEIYLNNWKPKDSPEEKWIYSNIGFGMLSLALERMNHESAKQLYVPKILTPLKMQPILFIIPKRLKVNAAQGYDKKNQPVVSSSLDLFPGAWAMKASAQDMQNFLSAAIGLPGTPERILYPMRMTQAAYIKLKYFKQGLAWQIYSLEDIDDSDEPLSLFKTLNVEEVYEKPIFNGNDLMEKTGQTDGFSSYIAVIPNKKSGIVILANRQIDDNKLIALGREILLDR